MKKQLFVLGLMLSTGIHSYAQQSASTGAALHADTVQAVHRMFGKHRTGGIVWTIIGAAFAGRIAGASAGGSGNGSGTVVGIVALGGIPAGIGVGKLVRFSAGREDAAISAYEQGKALPHYVQRRLKKAKYFRD
ncbi:hypothetical protein [Hymenobacter daeguensis]